MASSMGVLDCAIADMKRFPATPRLLRNINSFLRKQRRS
jgi:hypothetical protein